LAFGANKNQNDVAPDVVLASAVIDIPRAFVKVAEEVKHGRFVARVEKLGMKDGVVSLQINSKLADRIPADALARIEAARRQIIDGERMVPAAEF
jgi:basic membrane protein A